MRRKQAVNLIRQHHGIVTKGERAGHRIHCAHIGGKCVAYITKRPPKPWVPVTQYVVVGAASSWEGVVRQCQSGFMRGVG